MKGQLREKNLVCPIEKVLLLVQCRNVIMFQHLIIQCLLYYMSSGHLQEVKTKENLKLLALKVVPVTYKSLSLIRGSKYSDLN